MRTLGSRLITECEMCGRNSEPVRTKIEGTILNVCKVCAKLGEILMEEKPLPLQKKEIKIEAIEFVPDFADKIREAREEKNLTRKELAQKIMEKETVITRIEKGMRPTKQIAQKLERFLGIRIIGYEEKERKIAQTKAEPMTIGDILEIRMRKRT